jgi:hypothetical protein
MTSRPTPATRYLVQVRRWSGPWRIVVRCWHLERALSWMHTLTREYPCVRIVHDGRLIESWQAQHTEEA